jgi:hypothetical protein
MSYCRWSSDNFTCDLYCYESFDGFQTHVASYRQRTWLRIVHFLTDKRFRVTDTYTVRSHRWLLRWFYLSLPHSLTHRRIHLPYAGQSFTDATEKEMFGRILDLARTGYHIPDSLRKEVENA